MDKHFDIESVTKHAEYTTSFSSLSSTISPEYIQAHSKLYGYPIFEITCALSTEKFGYGILLSDWPAKVVVKPVVKSTVKQVIKPIDVKLTKVQLSAKTINALKDICRDKSLVGFSSHKTKSALIDWMLNKL